MDIHATIEAWNFFAGRSAFSCIGDIDGDGEVGVNDLLELLGEFSVCTGDCQGDLDGDGDVDVEDVLAMIQYWGATCDIYGACCLTDGTCEYIKRAIFFLDSKKVLTQRIFIREELVTLLRKYSKISLIRIF